MRHSFTRVSISLMLVVGLLMIAIPAQAQDLQTSYTLTDGSLTFRYPGEWYLEALEGFVLLGTDQAAVDEFFQDESQLNADQVYVIIMSPTTMQNSFLISPDESAYDITDAFLLQFGRGVPSEVPGNRSVFYGSITDEINDSLIFGIDIGGGHSVAMIATTGRGVQETFFPVLLQIAQSLHDPAFPDENGPGDLSQVFNSADGALNFNFPANWLAEEFYDVILMGNANEVGGVRVVVSTPEQVSQRAAAESVSPTQAVEAYSNSLANRTGANLGAVEGVSIGGIEAAQVRATYQDREEVILAIPVGDNQSMVLYASMPVGSSEVNADALYALAESLSFSGSSSTNVSLTETYINPNFDTQVRYPDGWVVYSGDQDMDFSPGTDFILMANSQGAYFNFVQTDGLFQPGDAMIIILGPQLYSMASIGFTNQTVLGALDYYMQQSGTQIADAPIETTVQGKAVAYHAIVEGNEIGLIMAIEVEPQVYALLVAVFSGAPPDQLQASVDLVLSVAASISLG